MANENEVHWAICDEAGDVVYDPNGRAYIFCEEFEAKNRLDIAREQLGEPVHVEPVEVNEPQ